MHDEFTDHGVIVGRDVVAFLKACFESVRRGNGGSGVDDAAGVGEKVSVRSVAVYEGDGVADPFISASCLR